MTTSVPREKKDSFLSRLRESLASLILRVLYGRKMHLSPFQTGSVAGIAIFWYLDNGLRKFILVKDSAENSTARFVSCLGTGKSANITDATNETVRLLLGDPFYRSLDKKPLAVDKLAAIPAFKCEDSASSQSFPVHGVVWAVQITAEQAGLCNSKLKNVEVLSLPEYNLTTSDIAPSHKHIYQSVLRHIHGTQPTAPVNVYEQLDDFISSQRTSHKIVH